jgi:excisionase family DNA binding protein
MTDCLLERERFVTVREAGAFLGLSRAKIYVMLERGEIRSARFGKSRRIPLQALRDLAASCMLTAACP